MEKFLSSLYTYLAGIKIDVLGLGLAIAIYLSKQLLGELRKKIPLFFDINKFQNFQKNLIEIDRQLRANRIFIAELIDLNSSKPYYYMRTEVTYGASASAELRKNVSLSKYPGLSDAALNLRYFSITDVSKVTNDSTLVEMDYFDVKAVLYYPIKNKEDKCSFVLGVEYCFDKHDFTDDEIAIIAKQVRKIQYVLNK